MRSMKNSQLRYCSSPDQLQAQIKRQHDIDVALTDTDVICLSCYKTFFRILDKGGKKETFQISSTRVAIYT